MDKPIRRGDVYYADLNPVMGSEQGGLRPVLVLSNNTGNRYGPTVIVAAITSKARQKATLPTHFCLDNVNGLPEDSVILFEQLRTIDKARIANFVFTLNGEVMEKVDRILLKSLGVKKR